MTDPIQEALAAPFTVLAERQELNDGQTVVFVSDVGLPGCNSHGQTIDVALENLQEAREMAFRHRHKCGLPLPAAADRTISVRNGYELHRLVLWVPKEIGASSTPNVPESNAEYHVISGPTVRDLVPA